MVRGVFTDRADAQRMTLEDALKRYQQEVTPTKRAWTAKSETNRARKLTSLDPGRLRWFASRSREAIPSSPTPLAAAHECRCTLCSLSHPRCRAHDSRSWTSTKRSVNQPEKELFSAFQLIF